MRLNLSTALAAILCLIIASPGHAQRGQLAVGSAAPGLDIDEWVNGAETSIEAGNVYVVEFWATWCAPCRKSIPHLNDLAQRFGEFGLTIIGVSTEDAGTVKKFHRQQGDKMSYHVAVDRRSATSNAWMKAAGKNGIPTAFIVDKKGKIQFIGHPMDERFEFILESVLEGRYDAKLMKQVEPRIQAARSARKAKNWRMYNNLVDEILEVDKHVFAPATLRKFECQLVDQNDSDAAYTYARELITQYADDPSLLGSLALKIATDPAIPNEKRDYDVALQAVSALKLQVPKDDPKSLALEAEVLFHAGDVMQAYDLQKQAYFLATPKSKPRYKRVLKAYQEAAQRLRARNELKE